MRHFELSGDGRFRAWSGSRALGGLVVAASAVGVLIVAGGSVTLGSVLARGVLIGLISGAGLAGWCFAGTVRTIEIGPEGLLLREVGPLGKRTRRVPPDAICGVRRGPVLLRGARRAVHRVELLLDGECLPRAFRVFASPRVLLARRVCEEIARGLAFTERLRPAERVVELRRGAA
jgi:hypothetical protein